MSITHPFGISQQKIKSVIKDIIPSKEEFFSLDSSKCFDTKKNIVVESGLDKDQATISGIAFDYLARFYIARKIKNNKEKAIQKLMAQPSNIDEYSSVFVSRIFKLPFTNMNFYGNGLYYVRNILDIDNVTLSKFIDEGVIRVRRLEFDNVDIVNLINKYDELIKIIEEFIFNKIDDENMIIDICLSLAKMEKVKRGRYSVPFDKIFTLDESDMKIKDDLKKLLFSFKNTFLTNVSEDSKVVFNPTFGIGSSIVGGADADIYIDGTLYDFKVTKKNGWLSSETTQIIAYYLLNLIAKKCKDSLSDLYRYSIKKVALYKVRFEEIAYFDCSKLGKNIINDAIKNICFNYLFYSISHIPDEIATEFKIPFDTEDCFVWDWTIDNPYTCQDNKILDMIGNRLTEFLKNADLISILTKLVEFERGKIQSRVR